MAAAAAARELTPSVVFARRMCVFTECSVMPTSRAISFDRMPDATSARISAWRSVMPDGRDAESIAARAHVQPQATPKSSHTIRRGDTNTQRPGLASRPSFATR